jgi:hypothetical protein
MYTEWHEKRARSLVRGFSYDVDATEPLETLRGLAWDDYYAREGYRRTEDAVVVNWLRHQRTPYEWNLQLVAERQGAVRSSRAEELAYEIVRTACSEAIAQRFPELAASAARVSQSRYLNGTRVW